MSAPSIARSSAVMAAGTLVSRVLGLVRNALLIAALGATASGAADAFNVANMLPTQLYNLIIGGVLNAILVPQIVRALRMRHGEELVNRLLTAAALAIAAVAAVLTVAAPLVILVYASGLGRWQPLAFAFAFWCMPQIFFYGLYALWGQVLNARHSFGPYMWSPVLNNIISIAAVLAYLEMYGRYQAGQDPGTWDAARIALVGGSATLGIAVQALVLYVPLVRSGFRPRIVLGVRGLGLGQVSKVALWALLGTLLASLGDLAVTNLGSRAVTAAESPQYAGAVVPSTTMYANALMVYMLPQSLVTTSIITALFTRMSEKAAAGDREGVRGDLSLGLRSVGVFTVLFAAGIATLAAPALQMFVPSLTLEQASASGPVLVALALGIPFQGAWFTTQRVLLAYADTRRLVRADCVVGLVCVASCVLAYLLAPATAWMTVAAAGNTVALACACLAIIPLLRTHLPSLDGRRIASTYVRLVAAAVPAVVVGVVIRWLLGPADGSVTGARATDAAVTVLVVAVAMTVTYLVAGRAARVSELSVVLGPVSRVVSVLGRHLPGRVGSAVVAAGAALAPAGDDGGTASAPASASAGRPGRPGHPGGRPGPEGDRTPAARTARTGRTSRTPASRSDRAHPSRTAGRSGTARPVSLPADTLGSSATRRTGGEHGMGATVIGSGRYELVSPLPATLPRVLRHVGRDVILDREVTVLSLTGVTPHRAEILEAASRAALIEDRRLQRVIDVEDGDPAFIITEPVAGPTFTQAVAAGLTPAQVRAAVGEAASVLELAALRDLHHENLSPDSLRLRAGGGVQLCGTGIEAAALGSSQDVLDPLAANRGDARALVEILYFGLTGRWPGKRRGIPSAPLSGGAPVPPSRLSSTMSEQDADLDALVAATWSDDAPSSVREVAQALGSWDATTLAAATVLQAAPGRISGTAGTGSDGGDRRYGSGGRSLTSATTHARRADQAGSAVGPGAAHRQPATGRDAQAPGPHGQSGQGSRAQSTAPGASPSDAPDTTPGASQTAAETVTQTAGAAARAAGSALSEAGDAVGTAAANVGHAISGAVGGALHRTQDRIRATAQDNREQAAERAAREAALQQDPRSRAARRTTTVVIVAAVAAIGLGVLFAATNLAQLAKVDITDDDVPAAKTVPTAIASEQAAEEASEAGGQASAGTQAPASPTPSPAAPQVKDAVSLDPFGDDNEHPELAALVTDGDPGTVWYSRYYDSASLSWKQGIGIGLTLAQEAHTSAIDLVGTGSGGHVQIRATSPQDPTGGTLLAEGPFTEGTTTFQWEPTQTSSIVVWVTDLPRASDGKLKVTIGEITVR